MVRVGPSSGTRTRPVDQWPVCTGHSYEKLHELCYLHPARFSPPRAVSIFNPLFFSRGPAEGRTEESRGWMDESGAKEGRGRGSGVEGGGGRGGGL